eukprot:GHVQ01014960.1.p1 GENE.GHVQ01014960.1~~GHVQ01014960.1.p1  ORF type:complete len:106 (+),score=10.95 GHVQ01014960.1:87-404(+)
MFSHFCMDMIDQRLTPTDMSDGKSVSVKIIMCPNSFRVFHNLTLCSVEVIVTRLTDGYSDATVCWRPAGVWLKTCQADYISVLLPNTRQFGNDTNKAYDVGACRD